MMIEHNPYMLVSSDFIVDFGKRHLEPVQDLDVVSHDDYYRQKNDEDRVDPVQISSTLTSKKGINYLKENHIAYFLTCRKRL
jgi:hypothetical protein